MVKGGIYALRNKLIDAEDNKEEIEKILNRKVQVRKVNWSGSSIFVSSEGITIYYMDISADDEVVKFVFMDEELKKICEDFENKMNEISSLYSRYLAKELERKEMFERITMII